MVLNGVRQMVAEFHRSFGLPVRYHPMLVPSERDIRERLLVEEVEEYLEAEELRDLCGVAQELADVVYVAYGTSLVYGFDLDAVVAEVHRANMSKLGADGKPIYRADGKVLKGENYRKPDIKTTLLLSANYGCNWSDER